MTDEARRAELAECLRVKGELLPEASREVASAFESAYRVIMAQCSCPDCVAVIDRALVYGAEWRELLLTKRGN